MKRLLAILGFAGAIIIGCGGRHGHKPPPPPPPPPPPGETRMTLEELRVRQRFAAENVGIPSQSPYRPARIAADIARGGACSLDGVFVNYWTSALPLYCYLNGNERTKEQARAYFRTWLVCEKDGAACPPDIRGSKGWQHGSMTFSLNHQLGRQFGIAAAVRVLGKEEAKRYGTASKIDRVDQMLMDVLTGASWWGTDGTPIPGQTRMGDHPEIYRSRHYTPRNWIYGMAIADDLLGNVALANEAGKQLDIAIEHLRPCIGIDGVIDEAKCPTFRTETCTRCPCKDPGCDEPVCPSPCISTVRARGLTCHPGETTTLMYTLFLKPTWNAEFAGKGAACRSMDQYEQWSDCWRFLGTRWRPLK